MSPLALTIVQVAVISVAAPFAPGLARWCKARLQGRRGASPWLSYITLATLMRKEMVISRSASWVFRSVPFVVLGITLLLAAMLPLVVQGGRLAPLSDFVLVAGLLALAAVFLVLGGLDPGSAFGGMGASREMTIVALLEPAVIMAFGSIGILAGSGNLAEMLSVSGLVWRYPSLWLAAIAIVMIALAENARYPVDNPATHLELTMVHEAMVLEYSGPFLAMLEYASALKLTIFTLLLSRLIVPWPLFGATSGIVSLVFGLGVAAASLIIGMMLVALLESTIAKMRFYRMQEYCGLAFIVALSSLCLSLVINAV